MSREKVFAVLKVAEGKNYIEIIYSISLPPHILSKYQRLRSSLLSSHDFSLNKFSTVFSPRSYSTSSEGSAKLQRIILISLTHILNKTALLIESSNQASPFSAPSRTYHSSISGEISNLLGTNDNPKEINEFAYDIEDYEKRIIENLEKVKESLITYCNDLQFLDTELRKYKIPLSRDEEMGVLYKEKEALIRENEDLHQEIAELKESWKYELENARAQWSYGLDNMQSTYEENFKELRESHKQQIQTLKINHKEELKELQARYTGNEKNLLEKLEGMTSDQSEVLNKLNDKISWLNSKLNEDGIFVENICNKLDEVFEKYNLESNSSNTRNSKEKIMFRIKELGMLFDKNNESLKRGESFEMNPKNKILKQKLVENSSVLKEFETARSNLLKHFEETPKKDQKTYYSLTTR